MAQARRTVVETRGLVKRYGDFRALGPVDLKIESGATGLLGPNGAGKTTLIKCLLALVEPTEGTGRVLGKDIQHQRLDVRQRIGYMPERDAYIPGLSGAQYVAYAGELAGLPRTDAIQRAHEVLHYVGIEEERYRFVDTYSTGMRQKVKLAQALVHDPDLLFLDEPTNGLDPRGRDDMLDLIIDISTRRDISVILSSHLLPDVERVCPEVVVVNQGNVVAQGALTELQAHEGGDWVVRIKGNEAPFLRQLKAAKMEVVAEDGYFRVTAGATGAQRILDLAEKSKVQVRQVTPKRSSLEDLFLQMLDDREAV